MKKWLAAFILTAVVVTGCSDRKAGRHAMDWWPDSTAVNDTVGSGADGSEEVADEDVVPVAADELFDDFVFNFVANRKLQMERIEFPLPVISDEKEEHIQRGKWKMERFFVEQDYYTLIFDNPQQMELLNDTALTTAIVEKIYLDDRQVKQYVFNRKRGRWMLAEIRHQSLPRNPNAQFLTFYERFVNDSVFQRESLNSQIKFVGPDPEDDFGVMEGVITPDFWGAFRPDLPKGMLYNIVYGIQNPAAVEKIFVIRGIANGFELELTFRLHHGRWKLIKMTT